MIKFKAGSAMLKLSKPPYGRESLSAAALIVGNRAKVFLDERQGIFVIAIRPARKLSAAKLQALVGEFLNEALNHIYRQEVIRSNKEISQAMLAQVLKNGFPVMPSDPLEQLEPSVRLERQSEIDALMSSARKLFA